MRVDFDPAEVPARDFYRLLNSVVVPRPIAWVSSTSADGVDNLAPHSFFTVACVDPAVVQFTSVGRKHSQRNVEATREFVVNLTPEPCSSRSTPAPPTSPPTTTSSPRSASSASRAFALVPRASPRPRSRWNASCTGRSASVTRR